MIRRSWLYFKQRWAARLLLPFLWLQLILRWLVYLVSATLSLVSLLLLLAFLWLFVSEPGGGWLLRQAPGVEVEGFTGYLLNDWQADRLSWQGENQAVILTDLDIQWQPWCLLRFAICLEEVAASQLEVQTGLNEPSEAPLDPEDFRMPEVVLPQLKLPWPMTVEVLKLGRFQVNQQQHFQQLTLVDGRWQGARVEWSQLDLQTPWVPLDDEEFLQAQGHLDMQDDWPLQVALQGRLQELNLNAEVTGSLQHLELTRLQAEGLPVTASGRLSLFTPELPAQIQLEAIELPAAGFWQAGKQPLPEWLAPWSDKALLDHLLVEMSGNLNQGWQLQAYGQLLLDQQIFLLDLDSQLDFSGIQVQKLQLSHQHQHRARLSGQVDWTSLLASFSQGPEALDAELKLDWQNFLGPEFPWQLWTQNPPVLPWQQEQLTLDADFKQGRLSLAGEVVTDVLLQEDELQLQARLQASLPVSHLLTPLPSTAGLLDRQSGASQQWLSWAEELDLDLEGNLEGDLQRADYSFAADLDFALLWQGQDHYYQLRLPQVSLEGVNNEHLDASVQLTPDLWQASLSSHFSDLGQLTQPWVEGISGDLVVTADARLPSLWEGGSNWADLRDWQQLLLKGDYHFRASAKELNWPDGQLEETALALEYSGLKSLNRGEQPVKLQGISKRLQLGDSLAFEQIQLSLDGISKEQKIQLSAHYAEQPLSLTLTGGWQPNAKDELQLAYQLVPFDLQNISAFLPDNLRWLGDIQGNLQLGWQPQGPSLDLHLDARGGELGVYQTDEVNQTGEWVDFVYQELALDLRLRPDYLEAGWQLIGERLGQNELKLRLDLLADANSGERALSGHYLLQDTDLQLLLPFLEADDVSGTLQGQGEFRGHLLAPEVWGSLQLEKVSATDLQWPVSLRRLDAEIILEAHQASVAGDFQAGQRGEGQLQGRIDWQDELQGQLAVTGQRIDVRVEPWANLELHPDVTLNLEKGGLSLSGTLAIPSGNVQIQQLPRQAVRVSPDARVRNRSETQSSLVTGFQMDLELIVGSEALQLEALGLEADLQGRLRLGTNLDARGELLLVRGTYQSFGQDLRLRRARLNFNGPVDLPFLDVEAVRDIPPGIVGIRITGRVDQPETEIFSEPAMSNEQALSWLLTGAPLEAETDINALALSMGLAGISDYTSSVGEAIGIREFELSTEGDGEEASLVAAGYLNRRLSVRYGVGIYEDISRIAIRYELTRQFYIEVVSSIENSLDIFWEVDY
ncbi:translocation/assembly module TamB domain-containing protein [Marinospirillum sp.]|uniref:translocation/assembly module TamB domain-containing protein n=1 Tax=Marinospirillum sp. TaxID=2183934 RepID=UPI00384BA3FD